MKIDEIIVVEGRNDLINLKKYIDAEIIITHGYGLSNKIIDRIKLAAKNKGIIILTDPDFAGEQIRKRISKIIPSAKHAFIPVEDAKKDDNIGIENASGDSIIEALSKVHSFVDCINKEFSISDLLKHNLIGSNNSSYRRNFLGKKLGIGYANAKQFLNRLNGYGISRDEFEKTVKEIDSYE